MLNRSHHLGATKSCPCCSVLAGQRIYKPFNAYGRRYGGRHIQSWCMSCRRLYS